MDLASNAKRGLAGKEEGGAGDSRDRRKEQQCCSRARTSSSPAMPAREHRQQRTGHSDKIYESISTPPTEGEKIARSSHDGSHNDARRT